MRWEHLPIVVETISRRTQLPARSQLGCCLLPPVATHWLINYFQPLDHATGLHIMTSVVLKACAVRAQAVQRSAGASQAFRGTSRVPTRSFFGGLFGKKEKREVGRQTAPQALHRRWA